MRAVSPAYPARLLTWQTRVVAIGVAKIGKMQSGIVFGITPPGGLSTGLPPLVVTQSLLASTREVDSQFLCQTRPPIA